MESLVSNRTIKCLPQTSIVYGLSSGCLVFPPCSKWESEAEVEWWAIDAPLFSSPPSWNVNCVVTSNTFVATATCAVKIDEPNVVATGAAMAQLRAVVSAIREARPLPTPPELDNLLTRAVASRGIPDNIEEWAHQLAEDVGDLND